eukprot:1241115-Prorocentrum_lima.AAC.1
MTSSLVGSEMCIRDSGWMFIPQILEIAVVYVLVVSSVSLPIVQQRNVPVSYTHLTLPTICSV